MKTKDNTVECQFHPMLIGLLFELDKVYRAWDTELIITSGSEHTTRHGYTSLHYATPAQAVDIRTRQSGTMPPAREQLGNLHEAVEAYLAKFGVPTNWVDVVLESNHLHIEYQPKRPGELN